MTTFIQLVLSFIRQRAESHSRRYWVNFAQLVDYIAWYANKNKIKPKIKPKIKLTELTKDALVNLNKYGFCVIPDFIPLDLCHDLKQRIDLNINIHPELIHPSTPYDLRLHGIENVDKSFKFFSEYHWVNEIASLYLKESAKSAFTLAARLNTTPENIGSGGGWHRDSDFRQVKAMLYLTNVSEKNGYFQLLTQSHKFLNKITDNSVASQPYRSVRWTDLLIDKLLNATGHERIKNFTASAGTLIIFDSSTIHRGSPILEGKRYAITNYYYAERLINHSVYAHFHPVAGYNEFGLRIEI